MKNRILRFLQGNGEKLDAQIARALDMPISEVRHQVAQLALAHEVVCCNITRFVDGSKTESISCRISCAPPAAHYAKAADAVLESERGR